MVDAAVLARNERGRRWRREREDRSEERFLSIPSSRTPSGLASCALWFVMFVRVLYLRSPSSAQEIRNQEREGWKGKGKRGARVRAVGGGGIACGWWREIPGDAPTGGAALKI
jgi:hypothetical protein